MWGAFAVKPYYETKLGVLYHGDCLEIMFELLRDEISFDACITDPPYNAKKNYGNYKDNLPELKYQDWISDVVNLCELIADKQGWVAPRYKMPFFMKMFPKSHIVVVRRGARGLFRAGWSDQFETILVTGKPNKCEVDLWEDIRLKGEGYFFRENTYEHPGYTPYQILFRLVDLISKQSVIDPFAGTCGTAVACEELNRKWVCIEQEERWCEVAIKRIKQETKQLKLWS